MLLIAVAVAVTVAAVAHEIEYDHSAKACVPGGARVEAAHQLSFDEATGEYVLRAEHRERGTVTYRVLPARPDGSNGLLSVRAALDDRDPVTITEGVILTGRDRAGREIALDGRRYISTYDHADVDADGPEGFMREAAPHGACIRIGGEIPVPPNATGHATVGLGVEPGRWMVGVRYMDDRDDEPDDAFIALSIRGEEIGRIALDRDDDAWREQLFEVELRGDDLLRIDGRADSSGQEFCRISHVVLRSLDAPEMNVSADTRDDAVVVRIEPLIEDMPALEAEVGLQGVALRCTIRQVEEAVAPAGYVTMRLLSSGELPGTRVVTQPFLAERLAVLPDGSFCTTIVDRFNSHGADYNNAGSVLDGRFDVFGDVQYLANSAGELYAFREDLWVTLSSRHIDCLPVFEGIEPSDGRRDLGHRVVFDHWSMLSGSALERQMRMMGACGMTDMLAIWHTWMRYGYDRRQPQFTPASPERWSAEQFQAAVDAAHELGWRVALHENYNHMDWDSPYNAPTPAREFGEPDRPGAGDPAEAEAEAQTLRSVFHDDYPDRRPQNPWALARDADMRVAIGPLTRPSPPAFPISADKMLFYSQIESHAIRELYGMTAGYLDVTPTNSPGMNTWDLHIDLDARNREARGGNQAYRHAWRLFDHHRDIFGITTGEGGWAATYHAGHIDAVEREVRGRMAAPVLPEHELTVVRPLSLHHGMGYYSRFFDADAHSSTYDFDLYRAMQVAFGHAGFIHDTILPGNIPGPEAIREYYLMRALQEAFADAALEAIEYFDAGEWISGDEALTRGLDLNQARLRISYAGGLQIALNFDRAEDWTLEMGGSPVALPPKGWLAVADGIGLRAGTVREQGEVRDFCASAAYDYRNDRDDPGFGHIVVRESGLPGLSEREAPGILVCLREGAERLDVQVPAQLTAAGRLNLTVLNSGDAQTVPVGLAGMTVAGPVTVTDYQGNRDGQFRSDVTWEDARPGTWTLSLAYTYTDPGHLDEANAIELEDAFDGEPIVVGEPGEEEAVASAGRRANFVEVAAQLRYPRRVSAGGQVVFRLDRLQFGEVIDDDFAEDVRLILRNAQTGETVELRVPEVSVIQREEIDGFGGQIEFPANSITTFEIG
jgi:hypothetical protein